MKHPAQSRLSPSSSKPRDRGASEQRLIQAVGEVLARDGFANVGINAVAKQAGVDKVLIYRYFGGLPELVRQWGASGRFWPDVNELMGAHPEAVLALPTSERWAWFFDRFIDSLRSRPLTVEILASEIAAPGELSRILDVEREAWGEQVVQLLGGPEFNSRPHLRALTLLLVVGIQMLLVRARHTAHFSGIDVQSDAGWALLKAALRTTSLDVLPVSAQGRASPG